MTKMVSLKMLENLLLGIAIGDAYGAGVEFQDRDWIKKNVDFKSFINNRNNINVTEDKKSVFTENYSEWDYTDDTEMTIGLINTLISKKIFSEDLLVKMWLKEYEKGKREKGFGRNGHGSMRWFYSGEKSINDIREFQRNRKNPGNAPAMRAVPLGLVDENYINDYARINACATHPNENAIISSQCIARAAEYVIIKKGNLINIIDYCLSTVKTNSEYKDYLNKVNNLPEYESLKDNEFEVLCGKQPIEKPYFLDGIKGLPSDSKYTTGAVLYVIKQSINAFDALKKSILLGGDVDSIASITTGIMSGRYGIVEIPDFMKKNVEGIIYIKEIASKFKTYIDEIRSK